MYTKPLQNGTTSAYSAPPSYRSRDSVAVDMPDEGIAQLTEDNNWNIPKETRGRKARAGNCGEIFLKCCRLLLYIFFFCVVLVSGVLSVLYLVSLEATYGKVTERDKRNLTVSVVVCASVYPLLSLVRTIWRVIVQDQNRIGFGRAVVTVVCELMSTAGLYLLLFRVFVQLDSASHIIVLLGLPVAPAFIKCLRPLSKCKGSCRCRRVFLTIVSIFPFLLQCGALSYFVYMLPTFQPEGRQETRFWLLAAVLLYSVGFLENFFTRRRETGQVRCENTRSNSDSTLNAQDHVQATQTKSGDKPSDTDSVHSDEANSEEQKITKANDYKNLLKYMVKVLVAAAFLIAAIKFNGNVPYVTNSHPCALQIRGKIPDYNLIAFTEPAIRNKRDTTVSNLTHGEDNVTGDTSEVARQTYLANTFPEKSEKNNSFWSWIKNFYADYHLAIGLLGLSIIFPYFAGLACRLYMQNASFSLPLVLIPIVSWAVIYMACVSETLADVLQTMRLTVTCSATQYGEQVHLVFGVGGALWCSFVILTWYIWTPKVERMAKLETMFTAPYRDGLLPWINLVLRRRHDKHLVTEGKPVVPDVKICVTMWHEEEREMKTLLTSLFKLDKYVGMKKEVAKKRRKDQSEENAPNVVSVDDTINISIYIIQDDAFTTDKHGRVCLNEYVDRLISCLTKAARAVLRGKDFTKWETTFRKQMKISTPYGGRLTFTLPGGTKLIVHLKDKKKIRNKKRWSQVMYMYHCLLYGHDRRMPEEQLREKLKNTYIMTLDGDVDFEPKALWLLMDRMRKNYNVGAVCGRIHPEGSGPMVWYQKFEYAVGHWLQKASEHVFGCVLCCPGCFSLFRASALVDDNVLKTYTREPEEGKHLVQYEQGEDRWLCTLLLKRGYKIDYCAGADAKTFAPEAFEEFFIQRRRWSPSTIANMLDLVMSWREIVENNSHIYRIFMLYEFIMVITSLLAPSTVIILIAGSFNSVLQIGSWQSFLVAIGPVVAFAVTCFTCSQKKQLLFAGLLTTLYTFVMIIVTIGMILNIVTESITSPNVLFLAFVAGVFVVAAFIHPKEFSCIFPGILYYVTVPATFIFLTVFFVCNLNDVSWGTREKKSNDDQGNTEKSVFELLRTIFTRWLKEKIEFKQETPTPEAKQEQQVTVNEDIYDTIREGNIETKSCEPHWYSQLPNYKEENMSAEENLFWENTIEKYLKPLESNKELQNKFKRELIELRNKCVFGFFMLNLMLAIVLLQLQVSREALTPFFIVGKYEPVSIILLVLFGILLVVQVGGMLMHRWGTFLHLISSTELTSQKENVYELAFERSQDTYEGQTESGPIELQPDYSDSDDSEEVNASASGAYNMYGRHVRRTFDTVRFVSRPHRNNGMPRNEEFQENGRNPKYRLTDRNGEPRDGHPEFRPAHRYRTRYNQGRMSPLT